MGSLLSVFFAFLRMGEMTVPSDDVFDPSVHLGVGDIAVDDPSHPSMLRVTVKQSKTDSFRKGESICGASNDVTLPSGCDA